MLPRIFNLRVFITVCWSLSAMSGWSQTVCVQAGVNSLLTNALGSLSGSCGSNPTFNITNAGSTGVSLGVATTVNPNAGGTITVEVINSTTNNTCETKTINVINAGFSPSVYSTGCYGVTLTAAGGNGGCSYAYLIDGEWLNANSTGVLNYNFNNAGTFPIRLRVTCGTCSVQSAVIYANVTGPNPTLSFRGDTNLEVVPVTNWVDLTNVTHQYHDTATVAYCVQFAANATSLQFPLMFTNTATGLTGVTNYSVSLNNVNVYSSATTAPSAIEAPVITSQGYHILKYTITSNGCTATRIYKIYIAKVTAMSMGLSQQSGQSNCVNNAINFDIPNTVYDYPPQTSFKVIIACNNSFSATPQNGVDTLFWADPADVPNPISWTPPQGSCNCDSDQYTLYTYVYNPCSGSATIPSNIAFLSIKDAVAHFNHLNIYCIGSATFNWNDPNSCPNSHDWQLTNPSGNSSPSVGSASTTVNFTSSGNWQLRHQVDSDCGIDDYTANFCVADTVKGTINWGTAPASGSSVCFNTTSYQLTPQYNLLPRQYCGLNVNYSWTVTPSGACVGCNSSCIQITNAGTANPTITLSCACTYTITCTASLPVNDAGCVNSHTTQYIITLVSPPTFNMLPADNCLNACVGQPWIPGSCITVNSCNGGPATSSSYSYGSTTSPWNTGTTFTNQGSMPVTLTASVNVNGSACAATQNVNVVVSPPPAPDISGTTEVCSGTDFSLTASGCATTGQWSVVSGGNLSGAPTNAQISAPTNYQYTCNVGGCIGSDTHLVNVITAPTVAIVPPAANPCAGGTALFQSSVTPPSGSYTYQWSLNSNNTVTGSSYSFNPNNGDVIGLTVGYGSNCNTPPVYHTITQATVNYELICDAIPEQLCTDMAPFNIPVITFISQNITLDSITLNNIVLIGNFISPSTLSVGDYDLVYHFSDNSGCDFTAQCGFTIESHALVTITAPATVCQGASVDLNINPNLTGAIWSSNPCPSCIGTDGLFTPQSVQNHTISVDGNCIAPATANVNVVPNPTGSITSALTMCVTQTLTLSGTTNPSGSNISWTIDGTSITDNVLNPTTLGLVAGDYEICMDIVDSNQCNTEVCDDIHIANATMPAPSLASNPVLDYLCYDMPCVNTPAPIVPAGWDLQSTTWNGVPFNQNQICAGQGIFLAGTPDTLSFSLMDTNGCPMVLNDTVSIFNTISVVITYPDDLTICETETIQFALNTSPGSFGSWQCPQCPTCISVTGLFTPQNISIPTNYTIVYDGDCVDYASITIVVNPNPTVTANPVSDLCINEILDLTGTISPDVNNSFWRWNNNSVSSPLDPDAVGMVPGQSYEICYFGVNNFSCADTSCFGIEIIGLPDEIVLDADGEHCLAAQFVIPQNSQVNYNVEFTHVTTNNVLGTYAEGQLVPFEFNGNYDYVITIESNAGCMITQEGSLRLLDNPVADISVSDYNECAPVFDLINNSTGDEVSYTWTAESIFALSGLQNELPSPSNITVPITSTDMEYEFSLTVENNCALSTDNVMVYFHAAPVAFLNLIPDGTNNCSPLCLTMDANSPSTGVIDAVIYSWPSNITSDNSGNSIQHTDLSSAPEVCFSSDITVVIPVEVFIQNQCGESSAVVEVMVVPAQVEAEFSVPDFVCPGNSIPIADTSFPGIASQITYSITPANQGVYVSNSEIVTLLTATPGTYTIMQSINGCGFDSEQHSFTVGSLPQIVLQPVTDIHCTGESVSFNATQTQPTELTWNFGDGVTDIGYSYMEHTYYEPGTYQVTVTGISASGCPGSTFGNVVISGDDDFIILSDSVICGNNSITARTSNTGWVSIEWRLTPSQGDVIVGTDEVKYAFVNDGTAVLAYILTMETMNLAGCKSIDTRTIAVKPGAAISLSWDEEVLCDAVPYRNAVVVDDYRHGWNYTYDIPDAENVYGRISNGEYKIEATFYSTQNITVTARNNFGCTATDDLPLDCMVWPYYVANTFTPDGDGINDVFKPVFSNEPVKYHFWIFDRWGEVVFYSEDPNEYWIGDYAKNKSHFVPDGVYNWRLVYKSSQMGREKDKLENGKFANMQEDFGHVNIIR